jgi:hypothetical protein
VAALLSLAACSKNIQNKEAVKQAVLEYLDARAAQTGLNMGAMDVDVSAMTFERDQARATVSFRLKEGGGGMEMNYTLDRKGDKWVVRGGQMSGASPHAAPAPGGPVPEIPPGHPSEGSSR